MNGDHLTFSDVSAALQGLSNALRFVASLFHSPRAPQIKNDGRPTSDESEMLQYCGDDDGIVDGSLTHFFIPSQGPHDLYRYRRSLLIEDRKVPCMSVFKLDKETGIFRYFGVYCTGYDTLLRQSDEAWDAV